MKYQDSQFIKHGSLWIKGENIAGYWDWYGKIISPIVPTGSRSSVDIEIVPNPDRKKPTDPTHLIMVKFEGHPDHQVLKF